MTFRNQVFAIIAAALLFTTTAPSKAQANDNAVLGLIIGGAAGGFLGSNVGKGRGQLAATAVGALLGAAIGTEMGQNTYRAKRVKTVYTPTRRPHYEPVYQPTYTPTYEPRRKPKYASKTYGQRDKVVVHKQKIIIKHVYVNADEKRSKKRLKSEKRRRQLAQACYENPRRCAKAF